jgi:hypothetical protein
MAQTQRNSSTIVMLQIGNTILPFQDGEKMKFARRTGGTSKVKNVPSQQTK